MGSASDILEGGVDGTDAALGPGLVVRDESLDTGQLSLLGAVRSCLLVGSIDDVLRLVCLNFESLELVVDDRLLIDVVLVVGVSHLELVEVGLGVGP